MTLIRSDQVTYSLSNNAGGAFAINATTGEVSVADTTLIDYESDQSLDIEVTAESTDGSSTTQVYTIDVLDFNEFAITQVTDSDTNANEVSEAALAGTVVGLTAFAEDADLSENVTYAITNDPSGAFEIDEVSGVVTVATAGVLDFETDPSVNLEVTATSDDGSSSTEIFTINILDANEAGVGPISDTNTAADQVSEDAANGTFVGITAFADDPDTSDQVTYSLSNNAGGAFAINATPVR